MISMLISVNYEYKKAIASTECEKCFKILFWFERVSSKNSLEHDSGEDRAERLEELKDRELTEGL